MNSVFCLPPPTVSYPLFSLGNMKKNRLPQGLRSVIRGTAILGLILLFGTGGYMIIEGWHPFEAFYMTVISVTTVGYGEIRTVSDTGRVFTVVIIFLGMGVMAYTLGMVAQTMVEFRLSAILGRKKFGRKLKSMKNHYIICGYGRLGAIIVDELKSHNIPLIVIDNAPETRDLLSDLDITFIIDDATNEDILLEAGIEKAKGLVTVVLSDSDNLFITMSARGLNRDLFILARADKEQTQKKLLRAGANRVVLPYHIGGMKMAQTIIKPAVTDFLELTMHDKDIDLQLEELPVGESSKLNGISLVDSDIRKDMNVIILAVRKRNGEMSFNPSFSTLIKAGETLIAMGPGNDLDRLAVILSGE